MRNNGLKTLPATLSSCCVSVTGACWWCRQAGNLFIINISTIKFAHKLLSLRAISEKSGEIFAKSMLSEVLRYTRDDPKSDIQCAIFVDAYPDKGVA
jgi:hypothetical protein